jgi:hypothetical protein
MTAPAWTMETWQALRAHRCAERACFLAALQRAAGLRLVAATDYLEEAVAHLWERTEAPCAS